VGGPIRQNRTRPLKPGQCSVPGSALVMVWRVESCMGDTDRYLDFVHSGTGKRRWTLYDPEDSVIAFSRDWRIVYEQTRIRQELVIRAFDLETGAPRPYKPVIQNVDEIILLNDWLEQNGHKAVRQSQKHFHLTPASIHDADASSDEERFALLERTCAALAPAKDMTVDGWSDLMRIFHGWQGVACERGVALVETFAETVPNEVRAVPSWVAWKAPHPIQRTCRNMSGSLSREGLGDAGAVGIANCPALASVKELYLDRCGIGPTGIDALMRSPYLGDLLSLHVNGNPIGAEGAESIARRRRHEKVETFWADGCGIGDRGVVSIAEADSMPALRGLTLNGNYVGDSGAVALSRWPQLARLRYLHLNSNEIGDEGIFALARSPFFAPLHLLKLSNNRFGAGALKELAEAEHTATVWGNVVTAPFQRRVEQNTVDREEFMNWGGYAATLRGRRAREEAPEVLRFRVLLHSHRLLSLVVAQACEVIEVRRSQTGIVPGDVIHLCFPEREGPPHPKVPAEGETATGWFKTVDCEVAPWMEEHKYLAQKVPSTILSAVEDRKTFCTIEAGALSFGEIE
jgi:hypothetical protein